MYWLEGGGGLRNLFSEPQFRPSELTITIRYSDWWWWENNAPLTMREDWLHHFVGNPGLRKLRVEYETLSWKKAEMMRIIERNKKWKLFVGRIDGSDDFEGYLSADKTALTEWTWKGTSKLGGQTWSHHGKDEMDAMVEYVVVTDTWTFVQGTLDEEEMRNRSLLAQDMDGGYMSDEYGSEEYESEFEGEESDAGMSDGEDDQDADYEDEEGREASEMHDDTQDNH